MHRSTHLVLGTIVCSILFGSACRTAPSTDTLTMITAPNYCPYQFLDAGDSTHAVGFDIDVAQAIAAELNVSLTIEHKHFNELIPLLDRGRADFAMAAITPTDDRRQDVLFSAIYYTQAMAIVSRRDRPFITLGSLIQKTVGVQANSFHSQDLLDYSRIQQKPFETTQDVITAVKRKRVDAAILDQTIAPKYVTAASQLEWHPVPPRDNPAGVAIAFPLTADSLRTNVNTALETLKTDGRLTKLVHKWFDDYRCPADAGS